MASDISLKTTATNLELQYIHAQLLEQTWIFSCSLADFPYNGTALIPSLKTASYPIILLAASVHTRMAAPVKDHFLDLERHRRQLEENVSRLQTALQHWRLCDAEYEELKEAIEASPESIGAKELQHIREGFKGEVISDSEVDQLFEKPHKTIINLLDRRIDYVTKNVETLEKQLQSAEQKLATATVVMDPDVRDEDGLPFTDIIEELDENDNVVSSHLQRPGDMQPQMMEALAKAGIKDKDVLEGGEEDKGDANGTEVEEEVTEDPKAENQGTLPIKSTEEKHTPQAPIQEEQPAKAEAKPPANPSKPPTKRAVSFADDTKPGDDEILDQESLPPVSRNAKIMADLMEQARLQAIPSPNPVIPEDESPEDAELRREMLRYGMTDIAPIVAELEIDEEGDSEYEEAYSDYDEEPEDEDEYDENGRYKYRVVDENIHARMQELQEKLGFKSTRELMEESRMEMEDVDPDNGKLLDGGIGRITVHPTAPAKSSLKTTEKTPETKPAGKGVKFASELDIADSSTEPAETAAPEPTFVDPMRTTIVERAPTAPPAAPATTAAPKKASRFKKAKTAATTSSTLDTLPIRQPHTAPTRFLDADTDVRTAPAGPEGRTLADAIVERDLPSDVKEPDEFDAALLHQEAAVEYNRMRNRMIQKEGGFVKEREAPIEYPEDVDEGGKRLSRFKAARLARQ